MKRNHNKGFTLIELISAIAILSIVGISAFTLLMFSIRSNNMIVTGTSAAQDADLLNKRLEILFDREDCFVAVATSGEPTESGVENSSITISFHPPESNGSSVYAWTGESLDFSNGTLRILNENSEEILQDKLSDFAVERVPNTNLLKVSYTIGDRSFLKLFRVNFKPA